jgi:hypothetical protein
MPTFTRPTVYTNVSYLGSFNAHVRRHSGNPGTDYPCAVGTAVYALANGRVVGWGWSDLVGWWLAIDYDNGWGSDYLHLRSRPVVHFGQRVTSRTRVAWSGRTGSLARGAHLHVSLRNRHGSHLLDRGNRDLEQYLVGATPRPPATPTTIPFITPIQEDTDMAIAIIDNGKRVLQLSISTGIAIDITGKDETIKVLRNGKAANKGPEGQEYRLTSAQFARLDTHVLAPIRAALAASTGRVALTQEQIDLLAAAVNEGVGSELAEQLRADIQANGAAIVAELKATLPASVVAEFAAQLGA